eukprot:33250-Chlamydomonas_euryale.AAC.8
MSQTLSLSATLLSERIDALLCLSHVNQPDITGAMNPLASFAHEPCEHHWSGAKQVLRYLLETADPAWLMAHPPVVARRVSNLNGCPVLVSWQSKLQQTVARFSIKAEYLDMAAGFSEALYLRKLFAVSVLYTS